MTAERAQRIKKLQKELGNTRLLAVSKYSTPQEIKLAYDLGLRDFGENKVQDLQEKVKYFIRLGIDDIRWHFIGALQSNKVKKLVETPHLAYIHSLHNEKVLKLFIQYLKKHPCTIKVFLQVNTSDEEQKHGFETQQELNQALELLSEAGMLSTFAGLMTMGKLRADDWQQSAHECFSLCRQMGQAVQKSFALNEVQLSMGMSRDYQIALEYGASWVRIGSAIFKDS